MFDRIHLSGIDYLHPDLASNYVSTQLRFLLAVPVKLGCTTLGGFTVTAVIFAVRCFSSSFASPGALP